MHKYHASASFPYTTLSWWETFHVSGHHVFVTSLNKSIKVFFCVSAVNCPVQVKIKLTTSSERPSPRTNKLCATKLFKTKDIVQTRNATKTLLMKEVKSSWLDQQWRWIAHKSPGTTTTLQLFLKNYSSILPGLGLVWFRVKTHYSKKEKEKKKERKKNSIHPYTSFVKVIKSSWKIKPLDFFWSITAGYSVENNEIFQRYVQCSEYGNIIAM